MGYETFAYTDPSDPSNTIKFNISQDFGANTIVLVNAFVEVMRTEEGRTLIRKSDRTNTSEYYIEVSTDPNYRYYYDAGIDKIFLAQDLILPSFFSNDGSIQQISVERLLAHELHHYVFGSIDPGNTYGIIGRTSHGLYLRFKDADVLGDAVRFANEVMLSIDGEDASLRTDHIWDPSEFASIVDLNVQSYVSESDSIERWKTGWPDTNGVPDIIRTDSIDDHSDLLTGDAGDDTLIGGGGRDFLFGGDDDDRLIGGEGNDVLVGGDGTDTSVYEEDAVYNRGPHQLFPPKGIEVYFEPADPPVQTNPYISVLDGFDTTDFLESIEVIEATSKADKVAFNGVSRSDLPDIKIDGKTGPNGDVDITEQDVIDFSGLSDSTGITINENIDSLTGDPIFQLDGTNFEYLNFETVIGTDRADLLRGGDEDNTLFGGAGNDSLFGGDGANTFEGGEGDDELTGSTSGDIFIIGEGNDTIVSADADDRLFIRLDVANGTKGNPDSTPTNELVPILGGFFLRPGWESEPRGSTIDTSDAVFFPVSFREVSGSYESDPLFNDLPDFRIDYWMDGANLEINISNGTDADINVTVQNYVAGDLGLTFEEIFDPTENDGVEEWFARDNPVYADKHAVLLNDGAFEDSPLAEDFQDTTGGPDDGTNQDDKLNGTGSSEAITVQAGNDKVFAGNGADTVEGGTGQDTLFGQDGADSLSGGDGDDVLKGGAGDDDLQGGADNDTLIGGAGADSMNGGSGNDVIRIDMSDTFYSGGDGVDTLVYVGSSDFTYTLEQGAFEYAETGSGDDTIIGGIADNRIMLGAGNDSAIGGDGNDTLDGGSGDDTLQGGDGDDTIIADSLNDSVSGDAGDDTLIFKSAVDFVYALDQGGFEHIETAGGFDSIDGNAADNRITLGAGDDFADGDAGNDTLDGGAGADTLIGGDGDDRIIVDASDSSFSGDAGIDTVVFTGAGNFNYMLDQGGFEHAETAGGNDIIHGNAVDNQISLGEGNDSGFGDGGNDVLDGGAGSDTLRGGDGDDTLTGGAGNDSLFGDGGLDSLIGGDGADFLQGGTGDDVLGGGLGADVYVFERGDGNDVINDGGTDAGSIDQLVFAPGILPSDVSVSRSVDDRDLIVRIDDTGELITLQDRLVSAAGGVDEVVFDDGTVWDYNQLVALSSNTVPTAQNDGPIEIAPDTQATIQAGDLTANDSDPDSDPLTIVSVQDAVNGSVALDVDGNVVFTPTPAYSGPASFAYTVSDGNGGTATATVSLTVLVSNNNAPTAQNDGPVEIAPDAPATIQANDLTVNDSDPDGDTLTIVSVQDAVNGSVALDVDGNNVVFTPTPGYTGPASFSYTVSDGRGGTAIATASLAVLAASAGASQGADVLVGTQAADFIDGLGGADTVFGLDGDDTLEGGVDADVLNGNGGNDSLLGEAGNDLLYGHGGNDHLNGGTGADQMFGHGGDDVYVVDDLDDLVFEYANDGYDNVLVTVSGYTFADNVEAGSVQVHSGTVLSGNDLDNALSGNQGDDTLHGGDGNDVIHGVAGNDVIHGDLAAVTGPQPVDVSNGSFDQVFHANGTGQNGVAGWTTRGAGTWNPTDGAIATPQPDENVMWLDNGGAAAQILTQTFDASARYDLTFEYGTRADFPGGAVTAQLYAGSTLLGQAVMQPGTGWQLGSISVDGASFAGLDGEILTLNFVGTGSGQGQAQINNVELVREYAPGSGPVRTSVDVAIANASFDALEYADGTGQSGVAGWSFRSAGTWDPIAGAIHTGIPDTNVMWLHDPGAVATQGLSQTFDADARYIFKFDHGTRADYAGGEVTAQIFAGNTLVGQVVSTPPPSGWLGQSILIDGANYAAHDGEPLTIHFIRSGSAAGQAQIDNVRLTKEYAVGVPERAVTDLAIVNASFDDVALAEATAGSADGWASASAGIWNPSDAAIATGDPDENVLYLHHNGAYASQDLSASLNSLGRYILNFEHGTRSDYAGAEVTAQLYAGSTLIGELVSAAPASEWLSRTLVVDGDAHTALQGEPLTIRFINTGTGNGQPQINNVRLSYEDTREPLVNIPPNPALVGGNDTIYAGDGDDSVDGGAGNDRIDGGTGSDTLFGGEGDDTFVYQTAGTGADTITDFTAGAASDDKIEFATTLFADFAALSAAVTDDGTDATIAIAPGDTIVLKGVLAADLHADDFAFV